MGLFDGLAEALDPHSKKWQHMFSLHMQGVNNRLEAIERATSDLGRGDIGNHWQRFQIKRKFESGEEFEIGICPANEMWLIQSISSDGVQEKSPPYVLLANGLLIESVIKEGLGFEGVGGNQVVMKGERFSILAREAGSINCVVTIIRRTLPVSEWQYDNGRANKQVAGKNTHEIDRDAILARTLQYREPAAEVRPSEGRSG